MLYHPLPIEGAYLIEPEKQEDARGFFARIFCCQDFAQRGLVSTFVQANNSLSQAPYTLRGLHYQLDPRQEVKLVRCIQGSFYDVLLDLRQGSPSFGKSFGAVLSADNRQMMYVPKGVAHGFLTLEANAEVFYLVSTTYSKELERGIRWNDPAFNIAWPQTPLIISDKDASFPDFHAEYHLNPSLQASCP